MPPEQIAKVVVEGSGAFSSIEYLGGVILGLIAGWWRLVLSPLKQRIRKLEETPVVYTETCEKHLAETAILRKEIFAHIEQINSEQMKTAKRLYYIAGRINGGDVPHDF